MSDFNEFDLYVISSINRQKQLDDKETGDVPAIYLPWTQRILNPFPLASSGVDWGEQGQPWSVRLLAFYCTVYVATTNNGANFWTIQLLDVGLNVLASFTTAAIAANTWTRMSD